MAKFKDITGQRFGRWSAISFSHKSNHNSQWLCVCDCGTTRTVNMDKNTAFPGSLQEAVIFFANYDNCHRLMMDIRWPDGKVICPRCGSSRVTYLAKARVWKCYEKHSLAKFSLKVGTIFEDSPITLDKWLVAFWLVVNCKNGVSSCEVARHLNVTQKTAWFMDHRIRLQKSAWFMMHRIREACGDDLTMLSGVVEIDEAYIGGKEGNKHSNKKLRLGRGSVGKTPIMGLREEEAGEESKAVIGPYLAEDIS